MNRISKGLLIAGLTVVAIGAASYVHAARGKWDIRKIKGNIIYFRNGQHLATNLYDVKMLGRLELNNKSPLYIFSGTTCQDCDQGNAIFLFTPAEEKKSVTPELAPYDIPGREISAEDSSLLYQSRMFYGKVLPNVNNGIIWYQDMLTDEGEMQRSVYLIRINGNKFQEELLLENIPNIDETLDLVKSGLCKEIAGNDVVIEP